MSFFAKSRFRRLRWIGLILLATALGGCGTGAGQASSWPGLSFDGETAYVAFNQSIFAVQVEDGGLRWQYPPSEGNGAGFYASPVISPDGIVYAADYDGQVYALDAQAGTLAWSKQVAGGKIIGGPALAGDLLLIPSADRSFYAVQRHGGEPAWSLTSNRPFWATPLVDGELVYVPGLDHRLYALQAETGQPLWQLELGGALADKPSLLNGSLLVGTFGEQLTAVDARSGEPTWSVETGAWVWGNPTVADGVAYFGDVDGNLYAVAGDGSLLWSNKVTGEVAATPAHAEGVVYFVTEEGFVFARLGRDNEPLWQRQLDGRLLTDPIVAGDLLLVAALDGENLLTALDVESGAVRWTFSGSEG